MAKSFDILLGDLGHVGTLNVQGTSSYDLFIDENRQFKPADGFNTTIAFEGDINSIELVIDIPATHARHHLTQCQYKELKWKNSSNGAEGVSTLTPISGGATGRAWYAWEVPADVCANAGTIEISILFYDKQEEQIAFAWNTASYAGLKVEKTMSSVGASTVALDDILFIDEDTHNILAPSGYNNIICNYGDKGVSEVYFVVNRYLGKNHGLDILDEKCSVSIAIVMNGNIGSDKDNITITPYSYEISDRQNEGMALITWRVPEEVTAGTDGPGKMKIAISFADEVYRWVSNTYEKLEVGHSMFEIQGSEPGEEWHLMDNYIEEVIENYFKTSTIVFDPEA